MVLHESVALLLVVLAAAGLPLLGRYVRLPGAVLEIVFGIILGKSFLNLTIAGDWLPLLANLGFLLLMFHAGMEIDFGTLRGQSKGNLAFHFLFLGCTVGLAVLFARLLGQGVFIALVLSTTSLGLVLPTLMELNQTRTPHGQWILIASTLADFLTLLGITLFLLWHRHGFDWRFLSPLPLFLGFALVLRLVRLWAWWNPDKVERILASTDSQELGVRFSLALLFLFVALSEFVHLEPVLGAFLGGTVLSWVFREKGQLDDKLSGMAFGFLIPIFFIHVGMNFDLHSIFSWSQILFTLKLLVLALGVKVLPSLLLTLRGYSFKGAVRTGVILSTRLSLIVAAASLGASAGLMTTAMKDAVILLAILTCMLGPSLYKAMSRDDAEATKFAKS